MDEQLNSAGNQGTSAPPAIAEVSDEQAAADLAAATDEKEA